MTKRKTTATGLSKTSGQDGKPSAGLPVGYANLLTDLKARVRAAQLRAVVSVNRELILLYWDIGRIIVEAQTTKGYGKQVVERLAVDLQKEFPGTAGFSPQNVWYMRSFYLAWTKELQKLQQPVGESASKTLPQLVGELVGSNLPQPVAEIPWGHNLVLLAKLKTPLIRLWYAHKTIEHGWSRAVLTATDNQALLQSILAYLDSQKELDLLNNDGIPRMVRGYFYEMACVIFESARVLKPGAPLIMVNDNVRYAGASISVDIILSEIAEQLGFAVEQILVLPNGKGNPFIHQAVLRLVSQGDALAGLSQLARCGNSD